jgi:hypothetical protein
MQNGTPFSNFVVSFVAQSVIHRPLAVEDRDQCQARQYDDFSWIKKTADCCPLFLGPFSVSTTAPLLNFIHQSQTLYKLNSNG